MYDLHKTPFESIIDNILSVTQKHEAKFTFPTVASVARQKPELLEKIIDSKNEIAIHGFKHLKYSLLSPENQLTDVKKAIDVYKELGVPIRGFRAPYNSYDKNTPRIINELGFLWDAGIGYSPDNREKSKIFRVEIDNKDSNFLCIPLSEWSDDAMIDEYNYSTNEMVRVLNQTLVGARANRAVVMFDLHPIRIGQLQYLQVLDQVLSFGKGIGGWFPTVTDAVNHMLEHNDWGSYEFCCLLTGDIDNFYFRDYVRRIM